MVCVRSTTAPLTDLYCSAPRPLRKHTTLLYHSLPSTGTTTQDKQHRARLRPFDLGATLRVSSYLNSHYFRRTIHKHFLNYLSPLFGKKPPFPSQIKKKKQLHKSIGSIKKKHHNPHPDTTIYPSITIKYKPTSTPPIYLLTMTDPSCGLHATLLHPSEVPLKLLPSNKNLYI